MSKYEMGRDIGELLARVENLELRLAELEGCSCAESDDVEGNLRQLTEKEIKGNEQAKTSYCLYMVGGFVGKACPTIKIGDFLCVTPCPPCHDISRLNLNDSKGNFMCTVIVRPGAAGRCTGCPPGGHKFIWS